MYNDFQLADNLSAKAMRQKFDSIQGLETQDIREIYEKLTEQRDFLNKNNPNGRYDKIITKIDESITEMGGILNKSTSSTPTFKATSLGSFGSRKKGFCLNSSIPDASNGAYGKVPHEEEISEHIDLPTNKTSPSLEEDTPHPDTTSPTPQRVNTYKRNSPMQGSIISRLAQSLFLGRPKSNTNTQTSYPNNRFHNTPADKSIIQHTYMGEDFAWYDGPNIDRPPYPQYPQKPFPPEPPRCKPHEKCVTNQMEILRLMLLFMALRPTCRYLPRICRVANTQLDILGEILE